MKYKMKYTVLMSAIALLLNANVNAQTNTQNNENYLEDGRPYVEGKLGMGTIDPGSLAGSPKNDFIWDAGVGYLWNKPNFGYGAEISYSYFSPVNVTGGTIKGNAVNFLAVGRFSLTEKLLVVGKVGPAIVTQTAPQFSQVPPYAVTNSTSTRLLPSMYVGLGYAISKDLDVDLGYHYIAGGTPMYGLLAGLHYNL